MITSSADLFLKRIEELELIVLAVEVMEAQSHRVRVVATPQPAGLSDHVPAEIVLLPQVATEHGLAPDAFLAAACQKAGLGRHAWREPGTQVFTFQADVFGE